MRQGPREVEEKGLDFAGDRIELTRWRGLIAAGLAAIALVGVTLVKLFFYDIADLGTIPKTILFVTLGVTLLLISFLYNKYKAAIFGAVPEEASDTEE